MLADMLMLGRGIEQSFAELLESRGYELRVTPRGTLPFDTEATVPGFAGLRDSIEAVDGVALVSPVLAASATVEAVGEGDGRAAEGRAGVQVLALGMDPEDRSLYRLTGGASPGPGEVLTDPGVAAVLGAGAGPEAGAGVGDLVRLRTARGGEVWGRGGALRVSGVGEFVFAARGDRQVLLRLSDLQALSAQEDRVSFAMVRIDAGSDPDSVRAAILARVDRVEIVTLGGIAERLSDRLAYFRQVALVLASISLVVAVLLVGTIAAVSVSERLGLIAAMRAIGVSRRRIVAGLTAETVALCVVGGAIGIALSVVVAGRLEAILSDLPGLPLAVRFFVVRAESLATAFALLVAAGTVSGLVPALNASRLEVAALFHKEEP